MLYDTADDDDADEDGDVDNQRQRQLKLGTGAQYWFPARCSRPLSHSLITINTINIVIIIVFDVTRGSNIIVIIRTRSSPLHSLITITIVGVIIDHFSARVKINPSIENIPHIQRFSSWIFKLTLAALD